MSLLTSSITVGALERDTMSGSVEQLTAQYQALMDQVDRSTGRREAMQLIRQATELNERIHALRAEASSSKRHLNLAPSAVIGHQH